VSRRDSVDLDEVRRARESLAAIAEAHPELCGPPSPTNLAEWKEVLEDHEVAGAKLQDEQLVVRLPAAMMKRLDAYAERLRKEQPGPTWRRSDVVRKLLAEALDAAGEKPKRR
jgi:hypothetical protein